MPIWEGIDSLGEKLPTRLTDRGALANHERRVFEVELAVTAEAYAADEAVGAKFNIGPVGFSGKITEVLVLDRAGQAVAYALWVFRADFTGTADGAAFAVTDGNLGDVACEPVTVANPYGAAANGVVGSGDPERHYISNTGSLHCQLQTLGAPTYAATTDVRVRITVEAD